MTPAARERRARAQRTRAADAVVVARRRLELAEAELQRWDRELLEALAADPQLELGDTDRT